MPNSNNPLFKHFRQPAIYLKLPSQGKLWPTGALDLPESGDLPVYPMTVKDELVLKTPDALMNGESMAQTIQSCCPAIKDPWSIPLCDLDPILIAIRLASYGNEMDITSSCTECNEKNDNTVDLNQLLDSYPQPQYGRFSFGKLSVQLKPQYFRHMNIGNLALFEEQRIVQSLASSDLSDEQKNEELKKAVPRIASLTTDNIVHSIEFIETDDKQIVSEEQYIREFIENCDRKTYDKLREIMTTAVDQNKIQPLEIECSSCSKKYQTTLNFETSNFFA